MNWPTAAGLFYLLQATPDLRTWTNVSGWMAGTGAPLQMTFPTTNAPQQFFRFVIGD